MFLCLGGWHGPGSSKEVIWKWTILAVQQQGKVLPDDRLREKKIEGLSNLSNTGLGNLKVVHNKQTFVNKRAREQLQRLICKILCSSECIHMKGCTTSAVPLYFKIFWFYCFYLLESVLPWLIEKWHEYSNRLTVLLGHPDPAHSFLCPFPFPMLPSSSPAGCVIVWV